MEGFTPLYWHWLAFGMVLIIAEIFITSFTIFWFGLGACVVGLLLWIGIEPSFSWQVFIWAVCSAIFALAWFKWIKPLSIDKTKAGIAREAVIGETGTVIRAPVEGQRGEMRFPVPILGADQWPFISDSEVVVGDRVQVKEFSGNTMIVEKRS
ncbi:MAG: hypothetical protein C0616_12485 [Desulfuromonas sp.]|nr:MAG: hypothetical protein C0616_12485 [Desulfuromonas sp.]